jgi:hypothetical protein
LKGIHRGTTEGVTIKYACYSKTIIITTYVSSTIDYRMHKRPRSPAGGVPHGQKAALEAGAIIASAEEEAMEPITTLRVVVRQSDVGHCK